MLGFHGYDLIIILVIVLLLIFGPKKLPELGSSIARSIKEYRKGMQELTSPADDDGMKSLPSQGDEIQKVKSKEKND